MCFLQKTEQKNKKIEKTKSRHCKYSKTEGPIFLEKMKMLFQRIGCKELLLVAFRSDKRNEDLAAAKMENCALL